MMVIYNYEKSSLPLSGNLTLDYLLLSQASYHILILQKHIGCLTLKLTS